MSPTLTPARNTLPAGRPGPEPDPRRLAGLLARAYVEVRDGRRPVDQLAPLLAPSLQRRLARHRPPARRRAQQPPRVRRVTASWPTRDACEAAVIIERAGRASAVAVRLERHRGRWRVVELTAPEEGLAPLATASLPPGHRPRDAFDDVLEEVPG